MEGAGGTSGTDSAFCCQSTRLHSSILFSGAFMQAGFYMKPEFISEIAESCEPEDS